MITRLLVFALLGFMLVGTPTKAHAGCDKFCRQKCEQTAHRDFNTVEQCIWKWSQINAKYGKAAVQFEGRGAWNSDMCRRQCHLKWRHRGYKSPAACIEDIPCSRFK